MIGVIRMLTVPETVWRMARCHCQLNEIRFLRAASDGHLAADEKRPQFTHGVSRHEVVARVVAGDEHRTFDANATTTATHHVDSACGRIFG